MGTEVQKEALQTSEEVQRAQHFGIVSAGCNALMAVTLLCGLEWQTPRPCVLWLPFSVLGIQGYGGAGGSSEGVRPEIPPLPPFRG